MMNKVALESGGSSSGGIEVTELAISAVMEDGAVANTAADLAQAPATHSSIAYNTHWVFHHVWF